MYLFSLKCLFCFSLGRRLEEPEPSLELSYCFLRIVLVLGDGAISFV